MVPTPVPQGLTFVVAKIVVLGSFNMDMTVFADSLPQPGETVLGSNLLQSPGGKGSNQAIGAARLGAEVTFVGSVGRDGFGDQAMKIYESENIDTTYVTRSHLPTGAALIVVDRGGENQIAVAPGANSELTPALVERAASVIEEADVLVGQLETPLDGFMAAARIAQQASTLVILNPAPSQALPDELWPLVDVLTPNQHELAQLAGVGDVETAAQLLQQRGPSSIVVTRGAQGATIATANEVTSISSHDVDVVDSTGAGDAFTSALAVAIGDGDPIRAAVAFASKAGAYAVTRRGVLDGLGTRVDIDSVDATTSGGELQG